MSASSAQANVVQSSVGDILRIVLSPALSPSTNDTQVAEVSAALSIARAGMAISRKKPLWLKSLDTACEALEQRLKPVLHTRTLCFSCKEVDLPKGLGMGAGQLLKKADAKHQHALRQFIRWQSGRTGKKCRQAIQKALKKATKSEHFELKTAQIDERLGRLEARLEKRRRRLLKHTCWRSVKAFGKTSQQLRLSQHFIVLLGYPSVSNKLNEDIKIWRQVAVNRRAMRWCKKSLKRRSCPAAQAATLGAYWYCFRQQQQQAKRDLFVTAGTLRPASEAAKAKSSRPNLPVVLHFGARAHASASVVERSTASPVER